MSPRLMTKEMLGSFSVEKYSALQSFSLLHWQSLVVHRRTLWDLAQSVGRVIKKPESGPLSSSTLDEWERLGISELFPGYSRQGLIDRIGGGLAVLRREAKQIWAGLAKEPLSIGGGGPEPWAHMFQILPAPGSTVNLEDIPPDAAVGEVDPHDPDVQFFGAIGNVPLGRRNAVHDDPGGRNLVYLSVDVSQPNDRLIRGFAEWLRFYRSVVGEDIRGISGTVRPEEKGGITTLWRNWKLVPYVDLRIGAMLLGVTLSDQLLHSVLFPEKAEVGTNAWDNFKKDLKKHLRGFLNDKGDELLSLVT